MLGSQFCCLSLKEKPGLTEGRFAALPTLNHLAKSELNAWVNAFMQTHDETLRSDCVA